MSFNRRHFLGGLLTTGTIAACAPFVVPKHQSDLTATTSFQAATVAQPNVEKMSVSDFALTAEDSDLRAFESQNGKSLEVYLGFDEEKENDLDFEAEFSDEHETQDEFTSKREKLDQPSKKSGLKKVPKSKSIDFNPKQSLTPDQAYRLAELTIGIPASLLKKIAIFESQEDSTARNKKTGACGLGQLMPNSTLPEMVFKYSRMLGLNLHHSVDSSIIGSVTRGSLKLNIIGYKAAKGQREYLLNQCYDNRVNVSLFSMNIIEKMRRVDDELAREGKRIRDFNEADIYIAHFMGARPDILLAKREHPNALAINYANAITEKRNHHMFFDTNGKPRTVAQLYAYIDSKGGPNSNILIGNHFWKKSNEEIANRADRVLKIG